MSDHLAGLPIEEFIQALSSQLDRAQTALAVKVSAGLPLTFAVKDIALDLRTHVEVVDSVVRIRPAGPGEPDASILRLSLTTITRPMIEENTLGMAAQVDEPSLKEVLGDDISEEEQRRLEWAGIHTVSQLRNIHQRSGEHAIERVAQIPVMRLRSALEKAARPRVNRVLPEQIDGGGGLRLRIRGHNLMQERPPDVLIGGERVAVLQATEHELLVAPLAHQTSGRLIVETAPGTTAETTFDLRASANGSDGTT